MSQKVLKMTIFKTIAPGRSCITTVEARNQRRSMINHNTAL